MTQALGKKDDYVRDFHAYMDARKDMEADTGLCSMLKEYDNSVDKLTKLMQDENYDAQVAISLTNDIEYLGNEIRKNPAYCNLQNAFAKLQTYACECDCSTCTKECNSRGEK
ncbi:MAG: hypothetical protein PHT58_03350 [Eubacteriales bacterium]|nr:hypothetical protein [Eubacteriales bacterium]